jgi:hypothetical protein
MRQRQLLLWKLGCAGDYWADEVYAINGYGYAVDWRGFAGNLSAAQGSGAGANQDGCATLSLRRKREGEFQTGAGFDGNVGVKEDAGTGDVTQLPGMEFQRAMLGHTDLYGQVNLVASSLSALSHNIPPELDARRRPRGGGGGVLRIKGLLMWEVIRFGKGNAKFSRYRK